MYNNARKINKNLTLVILFEATIKTSFALVCEKLKFVVYLNENKTYFIRYYYCRAKNNFEKKIKFLLLAHANTL